MEKKILDLTERLMLLKEVTAGTYDDKHISLVFFPFFKSIGETEINDFERYVTDAGFKKEDIQLLLNARNLYKNRYKTLLK